MEELENEISTQAEENTVSLASAQALADALAKIEVYTPTTWVDNSSPDIDAEHLNKPEQAIKRVTDALNSAVDVIKDLQSQVTKNSGAISDVNNNLSKKADATSLSSYALKSDLPKYKDVPIDFSTLTFSPNIGGYVCITKIADLIGTFTTVLSATVVRWSNLTSDTSVMLDGSGSYLTIRQDTDSKKGNITVRFVYV